MALLLGSSASCDCRLSSRPTVAARATCHLRVAQSCRHKRPSRGQLQVTSVIPSSTAPPKQNPPDLPSFLLSKRIVYLGMSLAPSVTELLMAEFMYLQTESETQPIYFYINSAGVQRGGDKLGYESEAFAIHDLICHCIKPPVYTVCIGNAFGEAAMLLAAGVKGKRAALPSASIMLRQPMQRFTQMQASDVDIYRQELRRAKQNMMKMLSIHTGHSMEKIEKDTARTRYFNPYEAIEYKIIDRVLDPTAEELRAISEASTYN